MTIALIVIGILILLLFVIIYVHKISMDNIIHRVEQIEKKLGMEDDLD